jgi:hypothetical protein
MEHDLHRFKEDVHLEAVHFCESQVWNFIIIVMFSLPLTFLGCHQSNQ